MICYFVILVFGVVNFRCCVVYVECMYVIFGRFVGMYCVRVWGV